MKSKPVLEIRVDRTNLDPSLTVVCPGYENRVWRDKALARDTFDRHLASFALPYSETSDFNDANAAALLRRAAKAVYATDKYSKRGEFGELLLHAICRDIFKSQPAISKIHFKDASNDTVKGFDSVHVVETSSKLELWLGEVKFYEDLNSAVYDMTKELKSHLESDYLRGEFVVIVNKLDENWRHSASVAKLLDNNSSLDDIFDALTIPILLTYNSSVVGAHERVTNDYVVDLTEEAEGAWAKFKEKCEIEWDIRLRLILLPLNSKVRLVQLMQERLVAWQQV